MPYQAWRETCSPRKSAMNAAKIGFSAANAVAEATEVIVRLGVQAEKCRPSETPEASVNSHCVLLIARSSPKCRHSANGAREPAPNTLRQKAIASAGAAVAAI